MQVPDYFHDPRNPESYIIPSEYSLMNDDEFAEFIRSSLEPPKMPEVHEPMQHQTTPPKDPYNMLNLPPSMIARAADVDRLHRLFVDDGGDPFEVEINCAVSPIDSLGRQLKVVLHQEYPFTKEDRFGLVFTRSGLVMCKASSIEEIDGHSVLSFSMLEIARNLRTGGY